MRECKYCDSNIIIKKGVKYNKQCFYCRGCKKYFTEGKDNRVKRTAEQKGLAIALHLYNNSMRSVQQVINAMYDTKISINLISNWVKSFKKSYSDVDKTNNKHRTIETIEMDELLSKCQELKENKDLKYGLLLMENGTKLIHFE